MSFADDLRRFGPGSDVRLSQGEAEAYCARLTATHYENFSVVTWLTPKELRPAFASVYAFCRWSDDLGDEVGDRAKARELLAWWRTELTALFEGRPRHPVMMALQPTIREYGIPIGPFEALISAFEQDQEVLEYDTFDQLVDYCTRSADPVGHLVLYLARSFNAENERLSDKTCTALQLANFWQDVARDLEIGRIYLPREDCERFGVSREQIRSLRFDKKFADLMRLEVDRTRAIFLEGWPLVERLPRKIAVDVDLFTRGGMLVLERIEKQGYDVLSRRPALSKLDKAALLIRSLASPRGTKTSRGGRRTSPAPAGAGGA